MSKDSNINTDNRRMIGESYTYFIYEVILTYILVSKRERECCLISESNLNKNQKMI